MDLLRGRITPESFSGVVKRTRTPTDLDMSFPTYTSRVAGLITVTPTPPPEKTVDLSALPTSAKSFGGLIEWRTENDQRLLALTGSCMGRQDLRLNGDQFIETLPPLYSEDCEAKKMRYQIGPIFEDVPYECFTNCAHNVVHSVVQR